MAHRFDLNRDLKLAEVGGSRKSSETEAFVRFAYEIFGVFHAAMTWGSRSEVAMAFSRESAMSSVRGLQVGADDHRLGGLDTRCNCACPSTRRTFHTSHSAVLHPRLISYGPRDGGFPRLFHKEQKPGTLLRHSRRLL